ncbi:MAG: tRNA pseudouridine(38-40) synthase TruA, partial [Flavobacteriaceae bacterium]|nr:tRNA pseudouridine(38-40) synthase TruA [Flavobacteriaceae bacterium]
IEEIDKDFNVINDSKEKEYLYLFAFGDKFHPFCAPIMTTILADLDISLMMKAAKLFVGEHNFKAYCYRPSETGNFIRVIENCELVENDQYTANFFPEKSYLLKVRAKGFGRNQIRLMMGALIEVGKGELSLNDFKKTLSEDFDEQLSYIAPASGLILNKVEFNL